MQEWLILSVALVVGSVGGPAAQQQAPYLLIGAGMENCPEGYVCAWENPNFQGRGVAIFGDEAAWDSIPPEYNFINDNAESFYNNGYGAGQDENPDVLLYRGTNPNSNSSGEPLTLCNGEALAHAAWWVNRVSSNDWEFLGYCNGSPNPSPAGEYRVITWNICSNICHEEGVPVDLLGEVARVAEAGQGADLLMLQEMCTGDIDELSSRLPGWTFEHATFYKESGAPVSCAEEDRGDFGIIVGTREGVDGYSIQPQMSPPGRAQKVALCVRQSALGVQACAAHFSNRIDDPTQSYRFLQAQSMVDLAESGRARGFHTLTGGDFNANPPPPDRALAPLYDDSAGLSECDGPFPEDTHAEGKLDYIFYDTGSTEVRYCNAVFGQDPSGEGWSDHARLIGDFVFS